MMMRLMLTLGAMWALSSAAGQRPAVVAMVPTATSEELKPLGLLLAARASSLLDQVSELHLKQTLRALREEGVELDVAVPPGTLRPLLGADRVVAFRVARQGPGLTLELTTADGANASSSRVALGLTWSEAIERGGPALARAMLGRPPRKPLAQPASKSDEALKALGRCYGVVLLQPLQVDTPSLLDSAALEGAIEACRAALSYDPSLSFAAATLALAQVTLNADTDAAQTLASLSALGAGDDEGLFPTGIARFWLLTRYQSNEAGVAFLTDVVARSPGALLARAYLGDTLVSAGSAERAEAVWRAYLTRAPASAWAQGRLSRALAREGRTRDAAQAAKKGLELFPRGREARLELGSRLVDSGQLALAKEQLRPLAERNPPRGEDLLSLGVICLKLGQLDLAASSFERALDAAGTNAEWRTRAHAFYGLALVEAKRGRLDAARVALRASQRTGLKMRAVDPLLAETWREIERSDLGPMMDAGKSTFTDSSPREASLFPLDRFGQPDPTAPKPPPPEGLALYRF